MKMFIKWRTVFALVTIFFLLMGFAAAEVISPERIKKPLEIIWAALTDLQVQISNLLTIHNQDVDDLQSQIDTLNTRVSSLEGTSFECTPGEIRNCGTDVGICTFGTQTCVDGFWGECSGGTEPTDEVCNGLDDDCDGVNDNGVGSFYYLDFDNDGFGNPDAMIYGCTPPMGYVSNSQDCDDSNYLRNPSLAEICGDGIDNNCNSIVDEGCDL